MISHCPTTPSKEAIQLSKSMYSNANNIKNIKRGYSFTDRTLFVRNQPYFFISPPSQIFFLLVFGYSRTLA